MSSVCPLGSVESTAYGGCPSYLEKNVKKQMGYILIIPYALCRRFGSITRHCMEDYPRAGRHDPDAVISLSARAQWNDACDSAASAFEIIRFGIGSVGTEIKQIAPIPLTGL